MSNQRFNPRCIDAGPWQIGGVLFSQMDEVTLDTDTALDCEGLSVNLCAGSHARLWQVRGDLAQVILWRPSAAAEGKSAPEVLNLPARHLRLHSRSADEVSAAIDSTLVYTLEGEAETLSQAHLQLPCEKWQAFIQERRLSLSPQEQSWLRAWESLEREREPLNDAQRIELRLGHHQGWLDAQQGRAEEAEAWLFHCFKPGRSCTFASIDPQDSSWRQENWRSVKRTPLILGGAAELLHRDNSP